MNDSIKKISLDVHSASSSVSVNVKKGDTGRKIHISLVDGGLPYQITEDCHAIFTAKNAEGNVVINACSIENNVIIYKLTRQATSVVGRLNCEIELYGADDNLITAPKFIIIVDSKVYDDGDAEADEGEASTLIGLIQDAATAIAGANTAASNAEAVAKELREARESGAFVGEPGPAGEDGITPSLTIGTVTTLGAGSNAFATITGSKENPVLNLGIPKGADGAGGGGSGGTGADGEDGGYYIPAVNSSGDLSWSPTKADMPAVQTVNIKGEKGDKGDTGAAGYNPVRGTDYWTAADIAEIKSYVDEAILGGEW